MYQLTKENKYGEILVQALEGEDLQLRRSALMDLGAVGYVPAGQAISNTLAENSMKLIALKGLLEKNLSREGTEIKTSQQNIEIMNFMDFLL